MISDTDLLDWLQEQLDKNSYTGQCVFRWSTMGRGWRLHETSDDAASIFRVQPVRDVREAIANAIMREKNEPN